MTAKEKCRIRHKWRQWLQTLREDLCWLLNSHEIFEYVRKIVQSNPNIQTSSLLYRWIEANYIARFSTAVRRLGDKDKRAISLYRLIKDIKDNPDVLTREYFVSRYQKHLQKDGYADHGFNVFARKREKQISSCRLDRDMRQLCKIIEKVKNFVDKQVAHWDITGHKYRLPPPKDVPQILANLDGILCKYYLLLTCNKPISCKSEITSDWKEALRHPWIEMSEEEKRWRLRNGKIVWDKREPSS